MVRVAINGFGRVGRTAFKIAFENKDLEIVAINSGADTKIAAHLLKHDSNYGTYERNVSYDQDGIIVDGKKVKYVRERDPTKLPWKDLNIDIVLECTGEFTKKEDAEKHLAAGAKAVIISAPPKGPGVDTFLISVNADKLGKQNIISNASCTTNSIAPAIAVLHSKFKVLKAAMTTVHSYTSDQNLLDGTHKDLRRARNAATNIVPTTTGAAISTTEVIPDLKGKFDGLAIRVPTPVVSLSDITALVGRKTTADEVNNAFIDAANNSPYKGVLGVTKEELVSSDFIRSPYSAVVDLPLTKVIDGDLVKVFVWYDNEWGFCCRLIEETVLLGKKL